MKRKNNNPVNILNQPEPVTPPAQVTLEQATPELLKAAAFDLITQRDAITAQLSAIVAELNKRQVQLAEYKEQG